MKIKWSVLQDPDNFGVRGMDEHLVVVLRDTVILVDVDSYMTLVNATSIGSGFVQVTEFCSDKPTIINVERIDIVYHWTEEGHERYENIQSVKDEISKKTKQSWE